MGSAAITHPNNVTVIDAGYIQPGVASIHLIAENGKGAFVDTGTTHSLSRVLSVLKNKGVSTDDIEYVLVTHVHLDHAGGAGAMMQAFPNAKLVVHPRGAPHMIDPSKLIQGTIGVYGEARTQELYGEIIPIPKDRVIIANDGFELDFRGRQLHFIDTPGHARHHYCIVDVDHRGIFTGDTMGVSYRVFDSSKGPFLFPATVPTQFDPSALHASVDQLMAFEPQTLYLTHYGPITPTPKLIDSFHRHIDQFVDFGLAAENKDDTAKILEKNIGRYLFEEVKRHQPPLSDDQIRLYLAMDTRLNAQGVAHWLERRNKP